MLPAAAVPKSQGYFNILILKSKPFYLIFKVLMVKIKSSSDIEKNGASVTRLAPTWYPRRESNSQLTLRRGLLYPFNYGGIAYRKNIPFYKGLFRYNPGRALPGPFNCGSGWKNSRYNRQCTPWSGALSIPAAVFPADLCYTMFWGNAAVSLTFRRFAERSAAGKGRYEIHAIGTRIRRPENGIAVTLSAAG